MNYTYTATHKAWLVLCPIWLADAESEAPTPIPRHVPDWWFDFSLWLNDQIQWIISLTNPEAVGFMFYGVRELEKPKQIEVRADAV